MANEEKSRQLGMPFGTANNRLRKLIIFNLLKRHSENICFRCGKVIETIDDLSIEHKKPWMHANIALFWDMENIAFSHMHCNISIARHSKRLEHGKNGYRMYGCRCELCREEQRKRVQLFRTTGTSKGLTKRDHRWNRDDSR